MPDERGILERAVAAHPFLCGMSEHHICLLSDAAMRTRFEANGIIFTEGESANRFYLIERGRVVLEAQLENDKPVVIDTIGEGDLLGWSWLFPPCVWHFTARAVVPTEAIFFYGSVLREYCEKDHSLGFELLKRMSEVMTRRLQLARRKLLESYAAKA
jgi:CRP/FNR family cyclic AMP-dependent transcriptional regulator